MSQLFGFPSGLSGGSKETSYLTSHNTDRITDSNTNFNTQTSASRDTSVQTTGDRFIMHLPVNWVGKNGAYPASPQYLDEVTDSSSQNGYGFFALKHSYGGDSHVYGTASVKPDWYTPGVSPPIPMDGAGGLNASKHHFTGETEVVQNTGGHYKFVKAGDLKGVFFLLNPSQWTNGGSGQHNNYNLWCWHDADNPIYWYTPWNEHRINFSDWASNVTYDHNFQYAFFWALRDALSQASNYYLGMDSKSWANKRLFDNAYWNMNQNNWPWTYAYFMYPADLYEVNSTYSVTRNTNFTTNWGTSKITQKNTNFSTDYTTAHITYG